MNSNWIVKPLGHGISLIELPAWKDFPELIHSLFTDTKAFIWRGQRNDNWDLSSTLDRLLKKIGRSELDSGELIRDHYRRFQYASRGRRGSNPLDLKPDEWWALGQHYGLATPLLDWTESPFVAAYFAFFKTGPDLKTGPDQLERRAIYALHYPIVKELSEQVLDVEKKDTAEVVALVRPMSDENPRLVNQAGLFTFIPPGMTIEEWIKNHWHKEVDAKILYKITVPNNDREDCLRTLNRMNINHLSLFPDLYGAAIHCNNHIQIGRY